WKYEQHHCAGQAGLVGKMLMVPMPGTRGGKPGCPFSRCWRVALPLPVLHGERVGVRGLSTSRIRGDIPSPAARCASASPREERGEAEDKPNQKSPAPKS